MPFSASQVDLFLLLVPRLPWNGHVQGRPWPPRSGTWPGSPTASSSSPGLRRHRHSPDKSRLLCPWPPHTPSTLFPWMLPNLDKKTELLQSHAYHAEALHDPVYTRPERVKVSSLHSRQDLLFSALFGGPSAITLEPAWTFFCLPLRSLRSSFHSQQATANSRHHKQPCRVTICASSRHGSYLHHQRQSDEARASIPCLGTKVLLGNRLSCEQAPAFSL